MTHLAPEIRRLHRAGVPDYAIAAALRVPVSAVRAVTAPPVVISHADLLARCGRGRLWTAETERSE